MVLHNEHIELVKMIEERDRYKAEVNNVMSLMKIVVGERDLYKQELSDTVRSLGEACHHRDVITKERDKYKLALQQVVEKSKIETWAWVISEEALGDENNYL